MMKGTILRKRVPRSISRCVTYRLPDGIPHNESSTSKFRAVVSEADSGAFLCSPRREAQDEFGQSFQRFQRAYQSNFDGHEIHLIFVKLWYCIATIFYPRVSLMHYD